MREAGASPGGAGRKRMAYLAITDGSPIAESGNAGCHDFRPSRRRALRTVKARAAICCGSHDFKEVNDTLGHSGRRPACCRGWIAVRAAPRGATRLWRRSAATSSRSAPLDRGDGSDAAAAEVCGKRNRAPVHDRSPRVSVHAAIGIACLQSRHAGGDACCRGQSRVSRRRATASASARLTPRAADRHSQQRQPVAHLGLRQAIERAAAVLSRVPADSCTANRRWSAAVGARWSSWNHQEPASCAGRLHRAGSEQTGLIQPVTADRTRHGDPRLGEQRNEGPLLFCFSSVSVICRRAICSTTSCRSGFAALLAKTDASASLLSLEITEILLSDIRLAREWSA